VPRGIQRTQLERVARMYASNLEASAALGITPRSFHRLCRKYAIESPYQRRRTRAAGGRVDAHGMGRQYRDSEAASGPAMGRSVSC